MSIRISHTARADAKETAPTTAAGGSIVEIGHAIGYRSEHAIFDGLWSGSIPVAVAESPVVLTLSALEMPNRANPIDLWDGMELRLFHVANVGDGFVNVSMDMQSNDVLLLHPLPPAAHMHGHAVAGHVLGQAVHSVKLTALTGDSAVEILLASRRS